MRSFCFYSWFCITLLSCSPPPPPPSTDKLTRLCNDRQQLDNLRIRIISTKIAAMKVDAHVDLYRKQQQQEQHPLSSEQALNQVTQILPILRSCLQPPPCPSQIIHLRLQLCCSCAFNHRLLFTI